MGNTVTYTSHGVDGKVSREKWAKTKTLIGQLTEIMIQKVKKAGYHVLNWKTYGVP